MTCFRLTKLSFFLAACLTAFSAAWCCATDGERRPNIVVIISDDSGYNEFSLHGSPVFSTPRIDSIASQGVLFTEGYTSGTVCSPTRAGLLTGRYQNRFGHEFNIPPVFSETNGLPLSETTLADVLNQGGYRTIALGKWHLGYAPKFHPLSRGFTDYHGFLQGARSYFPLEKPTLLNRLLRDREPIPETFDYMTDELGRAAAEYIAAAGEQPFFMYLAFNATHGPNDATDADLKAVGGGDGNRTHRAMTRALDRAVGVVLDALDTQGIADNTLVFFLNDNGGVRGHDNTPLNGFKGSTWEGGIRVPFAIRWPAKITAGQVFTKPVISLDIFPTAMAAAGIHQTPGEPLDGVDLLPWLTSSRKDRPHETLFWKNGSRWAVRDGDLKLVVSPEAGGGKPRRRQSQDDQIRTESGLFSIPDDPGELHDLSAERTEDVTRLTAMYEDWKRDFPETPWAPERRGESSE
jgi:arylsulfatase A-like enzyme